ncbi:DoxX family protein [Vibrio tapetis]|uniref:Putative DoxD family protein n=1 Tax=Vibrio tapetis subsp. tapetis TaxID=1671868 RepID=A0A2N8ZMW7_9VIBR|nr:DoxX family protein [Vibrio tapetis]SON53232.1 putative DoxD family protein [Vibrio tapetis subsp. tapetis]
MNTFDKSLRLLTIMTAVVTIFFSVHALLEYGLSSWVFISTGAFITVLIVSLVKTYKKGHVEFFGLIGSMLGGLTLGRLFSTMHFETIDLSTLSSLDPLMVAETGPGIQSIAFTSTLLFALLAIQIIRLPWQKMRLAQSPPIISPNAYEWGMTLVRIYIGMMFVAHFTGHILAGGAPFAVFSDYFGGIGLPFPQAFVVLAGVIELSLTIMLSFGLMTRLAGFVSAIYLFVSVGLGGHYAVGYVWVLPTGGWEFPAMWIFVSGIFVLAGGGKSSADHWLREKYRYNSSKLKALIA